MINTSSRLLGGVAFIAAIATSLYRVRYQQNRLASAGSCPQRSAFSRTTLSPHTISVIRATAPIISRHVAEIVNKFYEIFFSRHPEMKSLFSLSHRSLDEVDRDHSGGRSPITVCPVRNNARKNVSGIIFLLYYICMHVCMYVVLYTVHWPARAYIFPTCTSTLHSQACRHEQWPTRFARMPAN